MLAEDEGENGLETSSLKHTVRKTDILLREITWSVSLDILFHQEYLFYFER